MCIPEPRLAKPARHPALAKGWQVMVHLRCLLVYPCIPCQGLTPSAITLVQIANIHSSQRKQQVIDKGHVEEPQLQVNVGIEATMPLAGAASAAAGCVSVSCCVSAPQHALHCSAAAASVASMAPSNATGLGVLRSTMTTVTLSLEPRSTAALVSTEAAMRTAALRDAPFSQARCRQRMARLIASWLDMTSHSPSLASSRKSSSPTRDSTVISGSGIT
mmetsp:Transcript_8416/g.21002  ORF Transcript_8416/g.21002 Transcript_8416/m.21002 type:complete len:218 (+) Transcript_8416:571-1224(+)